ncbi:hypothetical protein JTB14_020093 [Gonioctena quinquepunctata]|nr:hypothetical protein JTB14_020093 [Gonioctena quinquepunctata]
MAEPTELKPYSYFDTPDGQDVVKKLLYVWKPTSLVAFAAGTFDVIAWTQPKGYLPTLGRFVYLGAPIFGTTTAFVLTTNIAASLRKKDDKWNWFLGGFAAGSVLGVWRRKTIVGFNMGMLFGILAVCRKIAAENGWEVTPPNKVPIASTGIWDVDLSLTKDRPGNWTNCK